MATVAQILDRLAKIQREIQGVQNAWDHDAYPNRLLDNMLPAFINIPSRVEYQYTMGHTASLSSRSYRMLLYVAPIALPSDVAQRSDLVEPFFTRVADKFIPLINLESLTGIKAATFESDDGLEPLEYAGERFAGIEFIIEVVSS